MVGSRAERQTYIHLISICNDENLACADYLPMIVWPARLSHKSDLFCSIDRFQFLFSLSSVHCTLLAPPLPLCRKTTTAVVHTQPLLTCLVYSNASPMVNCVLVKAQHRTCSTWRLSPTSLGIRLQDLDLPNKYTPGHWDLSVASRHKLASTSRQYSLLTAMSHDSTLY